MEEFTLSKFTKQGVKILEKVRQEFKSCNLDDSALPKVFSDDDSAIKLVFIGQFGAGKSSIIKMLTGEDVEVGADITTQSAKVYPWNGIEIIDTPGIHTELRPDHDELTYEQINHAALLIFVITNEGFSQRIGDHFRTLAIDQKRAANMVLVVNKMDRTSLGNVPEQQEIIAEDLEKIIKPYKTSDLYLSFLDTSSYFDSVEEKDNELKTELFEISGHDVFVKNLNDFVASHKVLARISKPLYIIADVIRSTLNSNDSVDDKDIEEFKKTIEYRKNLLIEGKRQCMRDIKDIAIACRNEVIAQGRLAANIIQPENNKETMENAIKDAQLEVEKIVVSYNNKIEDCLFNSLKNIGEEIKNYNESNFVKQVNLKINNKIKMEQQSFNNQAIGGALAGLGALIAKFSNPAAVAVGTPTAFAILAGKGVGLGADLLLKGEIGLLSKAISIPLSNFVTKLLTPPPSFFEEVLALLARNAGKIGAAVGAVGAAINIFMEVKAANKAQELENLLQSEREKVLNNFNDIADKIYESINNCAEEWTHNNIDNIITECDNSIQSLQTKKEIAVDTNKKLEDLLNQTESLIAEVQKLN